ncbi:MAG: hypothetical protein OK456_11400 [Thaumarchaeota archaeon]|nr:hypothetical protein [Nitrososphaerota archaeon]
MQDNRDCLTFVVAIDVAFLWEIRVVITKKVKVEVRVVESGFDR